MEKAQSLKRESLLHDELETYAEEKLGYLTKFSPKYYFEYKQHTDQVLEQILQRNAVDALIQTSKSILKDYFAFFPFQPSYLNLIMKDVNEFYDNLVNKGPASCDLENLKRTLSLNESSPKISRHFYLAERIILNHDDRFPDVLQMNGYSYDDVFYLPKSELYGHVSTQPQSLLYFVTKMNAEASS